MHTHCKIQTKNTKNNIETHKNLFKYSLLVIGSNCVFKRDKIQIQLYSPRIKGRLTKPKSQSSIGTSNPIHAKKYADFLKQIGHTVKIVWSQVPISH